ncbi:hypothetical protein FB2170_15748 [Maribacter sp. HTCC2170]|nr:hypothetical protein FB2170_15748 [Maribacter sp. HTCC2170]
MNLERQNLNKMELINFQLKKTKKKSDLIKNNIFLTLCILTFLSTSLVQSQIRRNQRNKKVAKEQVVLNPANQEPPLPKLPTLQGTTWRNWLIPHLEKGTRSYNQSIRIEGLLVNPNKSTANVRYSVNSGMVYERKGVPITSQSIHTIELRAGEMRRFEYKNGWVRVFADQPILVSAKRHMSIGEDHYVENIAAYLYPEQ